MRRALSNVEEDGECVVSLYSVANSGYAQIGWRDPHTKKTMMRLVHRVAWEAANGLIPADLTVDHICHNRRCLRLEHLRLLSYADNGRRNLIGRDFPVGWICKNNHPESERRLKKRGAKYGWTCRACLNEARSKWVANNPEKRREAVNKYNRKRQAK